MTGRMKRKMRSEGLVLKSLRRIGMNWSAEHARAEIGLEKVPNMEW